MTVIYQCVNFHNCGFQSESEEILVQIEILDKNGTPRLFYCCENCRDTIYKHCKVLGHYRKIKINKAGLS